MGTWSSNATVAGSPADVLDVLTEPDAIARWAPIPFDVIALDGQRLAAGRRARVAGRLAGRSVEFDVDVLRASDEVLELTADGPICLGVRYELRPTPGGTDVEASISVDGGGLLGRLLAKATESLLAAGALRLSLERLAHEFRPALAA